MVPIRQQVNQNQLQQENLNKSSNNQINNYPDNVYNLKNDQNNYNNKDTQNQYIQISNENKSQMNKNFEHKYNSNNQYQNKMMESDQDQIQISNQKVDFNDKFGEIQQQTNQQRNNRDNEHSQQKQSVNQGTPQKQSVSPLKQCGEKFLIQPIQNYSQVKKYNSSARKQQSENQQQVQYIPQNIKQNLNQSTSERSTEITQNEISQKGYKSSNQSNCSSVISLDRKSNQNKQMTNSNNNQLQNNREEQSNISKEDNINQHKKITKFKRNNNTKIQNYTKTNNNNENHRCLNKKQFIDEEYNNDQSEISQEDIQQKQQYQHTGINFEKEYKLNAYEKQQNSFTSKSSNQLQDNDVCELLDNIKDQLRSMQELQKGQQYHQEQLQFIGELNNKQWKEINPENLNITQNSDRFTKYAPQKQENTPQFIQSKNLYDKGFSEDFAMSSQTKDFQNQTDEYKINKTLNSHHNTHKNQQVILSPERKLNKETKTKKKQQDKQTQIQEPKKVYEDNETQTFDLIKYQSHLEYLATLNQMRLNKKGASTSRSYFQPQVMGPTTDKSYAELVNKMQNYYNQQSKFLFDSITNKNYNEYQTSSKCLSKQSKNMEDYQQNTNDKQVKDKRSKSQFAQHSSKYNKQAVNQNIKQAKPVFNSYLQQEIDQHIQNEFSFQQQQSNTSNQQQQNEYDQQYKSPSELQQKQNQRLSYLSDSKHTSPFDQDQRSTSDQQQMSPSDSQQDSSSTQQKISLYNSQQESSSSEQRSSINSQNGQRAYASIASQQCQKRKQQSINQNSDNYRARDSYQPDSQMNISSITTCENIQSPIQVSYRTPQSENKQYKTSIALDQSENSRRQSPLQSQYIFSSSNLQSQNQLDQDPKYNYSEVDQSTNIINQNDYIIEQRQQFSNKNIQNSQTLPPNVNSIKISFNKNPNTQYPNQQYNTTIQQNQSGKSINIKMVAII